MVNALVGQLGDMRQAVHPGRDGDEGAERLQPHDLTLHLLALGELGRDLLPRVALQRLDGEAHPQPVRLFGVRLHLEHADPHGLALAEHLVGVLNVAVADLGDVHQPLHAADVHEGAIRLQGHHPGLELGPLLQLGPGLLGHQLLLFFKQGAPAEHDIAPLLGELGDPEEQGLAHPDAGILAVVQIHLGDGAESAHVAQIHLQAALVGSGDLPLHGDAHILGILDTAHIELALGQGPREHQLGHNRDDIRLQLVADLCRDLPILVHDLGKIDGGLGLAANIKEHMLVPNEDHGPLHELTGLKVPTLGHAEVQVPHVGFVVVAQGLSPMV